MVMTACASRIASAVGLTLASLVCMPAQGQPVRYEVQVLQPKTLKIGEIAGVYALNAVGEMIGGRNPPDYSTPFVALRWSAEGRPTRLFRPDASAIYGLALNGIGIGAGFFDVDSATGEQRKAAIFLPSGEARQIAPADVDHSAAEAINDSGVVAGQIHRQTGRREYSVGFLWSETGGWREIPSPTDRLPRVTVKAINNNGVVLGKNSLFPERWFYYSEAGGLRWLPKRMVYAADVNDRDEIVGGNSRQVLVLRPNGKLEQLPRLPETLACGAESINNHGVIVGYCASRRRLQAVIWEPHDGRYRVADLNRRLVAPASADDAGLLRMRLGIATQINDAGVILTTFDRDDGEGSRGTAILTPAVTGERGQLQ
jgi:hypothetical protein